ncbi:MAG TPA: ribonuclease III [Terriglobales bacterium]|nr:ribonuclease III [Terriglobales bacterium]
MNNASSELEALQATLGHRFQRAELLTRALTHSSHANETGAESASDNEQLEFLGDAILGLITSKELFGRYPDFNEGQLSKLRAHLVSARHLIQVANQIGLGDYLRLGRGEERTGGRHKAALLVDALEAVIAAIYLDAGLDAAGMFILDKIVSPELEVIDKDPLKAMEVSDQKSALQEWLTATGLPPASYHVIQEEGPDHRKMFTVELRVPLGPATSDVHISCAQGSTKKKAEQLAAQDALASLKGPGV